jgi:hypothetical protein
MANDKATAEQLLTNTEIYLLQLGMKIAPEKSASFQIQTTRDSWFMIDPMLD